MKKPEEEQEGFSKPGFDGRLKYFELMKEIIDAVTVYSMNHDYFKWYRSLRLMYSITQPWLAKKLEINKLLKEVKDEVMFVSKARTISKERLLDFDEKLFLIQDQMIEGSKYLWLPGGTGMAEEELDINKWMEESSI